MNVLITGGSRGIGRAIAVELSKSGHSVLLVARDEESLKRTAGEIRSISGELVDYFAADVGKVSELERMYEFCVETGFIPDVLVLNAGIFLEGTLTESSADDFEATLNVNMVSIYHTVKLFVTDLRRRSSSKIILIGSTASYEPYPIGALYGVAKWALRGYAINLRRELMHEGVAVTFLSPGGTLTDLWAGEDLPANRLLEPSDIGKIVAAILTLSSQAVVEEVIVRPMLGDIHE